MAVLFNLKSDDEICKFSEESVVLKFKFSNTEPCKDFEAVIEWVGGLKPEHQGNYQQGEDDQAGGRKTLNWVIFGTTASKKHLISPISTLLITLATML